MDELVGNVEGFADSGSVSCRSLSCVEVCNIAERSIAANSQSRQQYSSTLSRTDSPRYCFDSTATSTSRNRRHQHGRSFRIQSSSLARSHHRRSHCFSRRSSRFESELDFHDSPPETRFYPHYSILRVRQGFSQLHQDDLLTAHSSRISRRPSRFVLWSLVQVSIFLKSPSW
jgi:hypothetical protein